MKITAEHVKQARELLTIIDDEYFCPKTMGWSCHECVIHSIMDEKHLMCNTRTKLSVINDVLKYEKLFKLEEILKCN